MPDDPRINEFPIPTTVDDVVDRIVGWVQMFVRDQGGPAMEFNMASALAIFTEKWGEFIRQRLNHHKGNPWPDDFKQIGETARKHGVKAVELARSNKHKQVQMDDFVNAGFWAAGTCHTLVGGRGCWCNEC